MFSGIATAVEAAALTACYALLIQTVIHRDLSTCAAISLRVFVECVLVIGGVLVILGVAVGLTNYLVGVQLPAKLVSWVQAHIESRLAFLLALNVFLLVVGWLMEIFAAIVVVVPLIVPLGAAFGIHPVHLGIIFVANLELGFLTPLVGINIFLASYRFKRPVLEVCRADAAVHGDSRHRRAGDHVRAVADDWVADDARQVVRGAGQFQARACRRNESALPRCRLSQTRSSVVT